MIKRDVVIIGAGAAGLMCARMSALQGQSTLLLERNARVGKKVLISGGGRCNFTNLGASAQNYVSHNPHFIKSALAAFGAHDFLELVEQHHIAYHEKHKGQLFCDHSSKDIVEMLLKELNTYGAEVWTDSPVEDVSSTKDGSFLIQVGTKNICTPKLVIACGGLSWPKLGVSDFGYQIARQFGHTVTPLAPALVPFEFDAETYRIFGSLSGIALPVRIQTQGLNDKLIGFDEDLLFTHRGISGPACLQISLHWKGKTPIQVDLLPGQSAFEILKKERSSRPQARVHSVLSNYLPERLAQCLTHTFLAQPEKELSNQSDREFQKLDHAIHQWSFLPLKSEGYAKAEVTRGGVSTDELSSKTMESKIQPGLYFIGEVVDVTGWLGGYNLQWAWASGYAAGTH